MAVTKRPVLGLWDLRKTPLSLGGLILFVEELLAKALEKRGRVAGVCVVGDVQGIPTPVSGEVVCIQGNGSVLLSTLLEIQGVNRLYHAGDLNAVRSWVSQREALWTWPPVADVDSRDRLMHSCGTTVFLQQTFSERGCLPKMGMKRANVKWALDWYDERVVPRLPIVVHLKNNLAEKGCSNADFDAWRAFFEAFTVRSDIQFVLIGNEPIPSGILELRNVVATQSAGGSLAHDLAVIGTAFAFMGMASGPCNMALFSSIPYRIYKNPLHHADEMRRELGANDHFAFAGPGQKIVRAYESKETLLSDLDVLLKGARRTDWEKRLVSLRRRCSRALV